MMYRTAAGSIVLALSATAFAQGQGPAQLWIFEDAFNGAPGDDVIIQIDETAPAIGPVVSTEDHSFATDLEFDSMNNVFYVSGPSQPGNLRIVDAASGASIGSANTVPGLNTLGFSVLTSLELIGGVLYAGAAIVGPGSTMDAGLVTVDVNSGAVNLVGLTGIAAPLGGLAFNGTLYAVTAGGTGPSGLYSIDLATGAASLIGTTGVALTGLEFGADGVLYAINNTNAGSLPSTLYTVNVLTGAATPVGEIAGAEIATGLTSNFNSMAMAGLFVAEDFDQAPDFDDSIYQLQTAPAALGARVSEEELGFAAEIEYNPLKVEFYQSGPGQPNGFTILSAITGRVTASPGIANGLNAIGYDFVTAMELVDGTLYGGAANGGAGSTVDAGLVTIDPVTGTVDLVGLTGIALPLGGLAYNGTLYAITAQGAVSDLYTINLATGAATLVGSTGRVLTGLEFGLDGVLYGLDRDAGDVLVVINPQTAASVPLGSVAGAGSLSALTSSFIAPPPTGCNPADVNTDGVITFGDVSAFIAAFNAGCP